jgi:hypothetical protein
MPSDKGVRALIRSQVCPARRVLTWIKDADCDLVMCAGLFLLDRPSCAARSRIFCDNVLVEISVVFSVDRTVLKVQRPDAETPGHHIEPIALGRSVGLVPTNANTSTPGCTPAPSVIAGTDCGCARSRGAIVCTPMHSTIDASNAHRCQGTANSSVRSIK